MYRQPCALYLCAHDVSESLWRKCSQHRGARDSNTPREGSAGAAPRPAPARAVGRHSVQWLPLWAEALWTVTHGVLRTEANIGASWSTSRYSMLPRTWKRMQSRRRAPAVQRSNSHDTCVSSQADPPLVDEAKASPVAVVCPSCACPCRKFSSARPRAQTIAIEPGV